MDGRGDKSILTPVTSLLGIMRARIIKDFRFEAAHTLPSLPADHKCRQMHGHSFKVEIHVEGEVNPEIG